jgi:hypothetical protein
MSDETLLPKLAAISVSPLIIVSEKQKNEITATYKNLTSLHFNRHSNNYAVH